MSSQVRTGVVDLDTASATRSATQDHHEKFLRNAGLLAIGDKYMDGYAVARVLGVEMDDE
ncbi:hypothetical protein [Saccharopolyspora elongata]|uniref:Uncharacterized protein n=1 Tax=Saccharopolyspora elongata TaxID=2530387 RepID=A0A4R4Z509_9PSEU|nr:hypothetical protein [Saccharopolyspora elongata]TDD52540.1 hypothetical protein E1288_12175 [Saccharopolyspora elongata]